MLVRRALCAAALAAAVTSAWACGDDDNTATATTAQCPKDDPETPNVDESECKALATKDSGLQAVEKRGCQGCHGQDMSGQTSPLTGKPSYSKTALGDDVELYPPNLTADNDTGVGSWADDALALAIRNGVDKDSQALCPQMTHFADMSDFEVYSIVDYLRSIPKVNKKIPRSVCPPTKTKAQQNEIGSNQ